MDDYIKSITDGTLTTQDVKNILGCRGNSLQTLNKIIYQLDEWGRFEHRASIFTSSASIISSACWLASPATGGASGMVCAMVQGGLLTYRITSEKRLLEEAKEVLEKEEGNSRRLSKVYEAASLLRKKAVCLRTLLQQVRAARQLAASRAIAKAKNGAGAAEKFGKVMAYVSIPWELFNIFDNVVALKNREYSKVAGKLKCIKAELMKETEVLNDFVKKVEREM